MLEELLKYNHVANNEFIAVFSKAGVPVVDAERLFSHILNAADIWVSRIKKLPSNYDRFELHPVKNFDQLENDSYTALTGILTGFDLSSDVIYKIGTGEEFTSRVSDILFHIVNHSTYHRGQIASIFRRQDIEPPVTDYVLLKRKGLLV
ncbi:DinB family protein [Rubrolithibacter danxiaensis]|uniref:DinB family protein n=1 Tax=Rubrolithibacter danxiaensis TaxID=3390805 RepID=UPI003BF78CC7